MSHGLVELRVCRISITHVPDGASVRIGTALVDSGAVCNTATFTAFKGFRCPSCLAPLRLLATNRVADKLSKSVSGTGGKEQGSR